MFPVLRYYNLNFAHTCIHSLEFHDVFDTHILHCTSMLVSPSIVAFRNAQYLLEDLSAILDTQSKRTLWFYIIPLLSPSHQRYCQHKLGLPQHVIKSSK